jgi:CPA1 family monovalent cation:H+ antiporter
MRPEVAFVALLSVATAVALIARRLRLPYTVALVVAGLALGTTRFVSAPNLTKELLYAAFLPGLLFEASFNLEFKKFWQNRRTIFSLAIPGVLLAIGLTGVLLVSELSGLHVLEDFGLGTALVFGAMIATTDPIAVVALFKSLGVPKRLAILVEGESLLNDGTGVVLFTLVLAAVTGGSFSPGQGVLDFIRVAGMGFAIGTLFGYAASKLTAQIEEPLVEITITTIAAYGSFVVAEQFHFSGVIATVCAGMWCGNVGATQGMSPSTRLAVHSFWEYVAFALNSVVFLLIGFQVRIESLLSAWKIIVLAWIAVTAARAIVVYLTVALVRRSSEHMPWSWAAVLTWGGLRGGLSMVLALALPQSMPHRELLITTTFGVVVLSILVQGLSMGSLLRRLGIAEKVARPDGEARARLLAAKAAAATLTELVSSGSLHGENATKLEQAVQSELAEADKALREALESTGDAGQRQLLDAQRQLLLARKDAVIKALKDGILTEEDAEALSVELDARLLRVMDGESEVNANGTTSS